MKSLIFVCVVGLLEHCHIVRTALMEVAVLIGVHRIYLKANHAEVFPCQLACLADILYIALAAALAGQYKDLLHAAVGDDLHFLLDLL